MIKATVKVPAKINLTLDVLGKCGGYHDISSMVCRIDLYDVITVKTRKDGLITLTERGIPSECEVAKNNAYTAAKKFIETYGTEGVDVELEKGIPVGGGLGGSSADVAGTLVAMKKAFGVEDDITAVANLLGSDSGYMSGVGPAIISGRGDNITSILPIPTLFLLLITEKEKCFSGEVYKKFDIEGNSFPPCTEDALEFLEKGDLTSFVKTIKNDLTESACSFVPEIRENINALLNAGADAALMTGSGSCSYGIFFTAAARNKAYKNLFPIYKERLIKTKTI